MGAYRVLISIQESTEHMELLVYPLNLVVFLQLSNFSIACSLNSAE